MQWLMRAAEQTSRLEELRTRRQQAENAIRSLLSLDGKSGEFIHSELGRLNGELNTITNAIAEIENETPDGPAGSIDIGDVSSAWPNN